MYAALLLALVAIACGGSTETTSPPTPPPTPEATPTEAPTRGTPRPAPAELSLAYINLGSPITVDESDPLAHDTFFERLEFLAGQLQQLEPDIIAVSEATWSRELDAASWNVLASSLGMEPGYQRANPWYPGQDKEASDETRDLVGFEEGEAILSRYPIMHTRRIPLNPRTSEHEGRAVLHAVLLIEPYGEVNVYVARLSGNTATREAQAHDLRGHIDDTAEGRPSIVFADFGLPPGNEAVQAFAGDDLVELSAAAGQEPGAVGTCCRTTMLFGAGNDGENGDMENVTPVPATEPPGDVEPAETAEPELPGELAEARTLYIFSDTWDPTGFSVFGDTPAIRSDGSRLYASDHNGIYTVIDLEGAWPEEAGLPD